MKSLKIAVISLSLFMCSFINGAQAVDVKRVVSPGGVEAWLVEDHSNPIVTLNLTFRGGAALDPVGQEGLANMVSALIDEGAGDLGSLSFQKTLNDLSIHLGFSAYKESFSGNLQTLSVNQERAFELLKLAITAPRFDEEPVERIRSQIQASLRRSESNPGTIASKALYAKIFPNHPYGRPSQGTPETVALIGKTHMAQFVASRFARNNLIIGVVGDITPEYLGIKLDQVFGRKSVV